LSGLVEEPCTIGLNETHMMFIKTRPMAASTPTATVATPSRNVLWAPDTTSTTWGMSLVTVGAMAVMGEARLQAEASSRPRDTPKFLRIISTIAEVCLGNHRIMIGNAHTMVTINRAGPMIETPIPAEAVTMVGVTTAREAHTITIQIILRSGDKVSFFKAVHDIGKLIHNNKIKGRTKIGVIIQSRLC
jgi:hypothetical protein